jgi:hypothetical protein
MTLGQCPVSETATPGQLAAIIADLEGSLDDLRDERC